MIGIPATPKIHIKLDDFATSDKVLEATLTPDIWEMIEWLSESTDTSFIDVVRGLLFQALYGRVAYEQLLDHVRNQSCEDDVRDTLDISTICKSPERREQSDIEATWAAENQIKKSPERGTPADLKYVGKSNVNRKLKVPYRMWFDLDRQAAKADMSLTTYVRGLLFKTLQGEVNYTQWQFARAALEQVKPPSRK